MSAADFVQKWSGLGTFVIAVVAVLTWFFGMRDDTIDAKILAVDTKIDAVDTNVQAVDQRVSDLRSDINQQFQSLRELVNVRMDNVDERSEGLYFRLDHANDRLRELAGEP